MRLSLLLASLLASACGAPPARVTPPAPAEAAPVALQASPPALGDGVVAMDPVCADGAAERCNAIDDNCNGRIDEGCEGAVDGAFVAAVAWNGDADVDLLVTGPGAAEPTRLASRGGCAEPAEPRVERAVFSSLEPGRYRVELVDASACGGGDAITASASIAVDGEVVGVFNRPLTGGQRAPVIEIELAPR
jgi:hypothetical protein